MHSVFVEAGAAYEAALTGLSTFAVWHSINPSLTLSDTIRPRPTAPVDPFRGDSSAAQPPAPEPAVPPAPDLAPSFHAATNCTLVSSFEEALSQIDFEFTSTWSEMAQTLKQTPVGQSAIFYRRDALPPHPIRYHGTYFKALCDIAKSGFLQTFGAGRAKAIEKFGEDRPVVYSSPLEETASWYPSSMVDSKGNRIGELLSQDGLPIRVILICDADVATRRINIRRGQNKQDAWLPGDIQVRGVKFRIMRDAINPPPNPTPNPEDRNGIWPVDLEQDDDEELEHQTATSAAQSGESEADEPEDLSSSDESDSWFTDAPPDAEPLPKRATPATRSTGSVPSMTPSPPPFPPPTAAAQRGTRRATHRVQPKDQVIGRPPVYAAADPQ